MASLNIGDKNVIINFIDSVKSPNVVSINWNLYNETFKIDNITTFKAPLSVYSSNFYCSYKYVMNLDTSLQYRKFTVRTWLDWQKCALQIERLPQQTDKDFQVYQADIMKKITITEIKQLQSPYIPISISDNYLFFIISAFIIAFLASIVFFVSRSYKRWEFITK